MNFDLYTQGTAMVDDNGWHQQETQDLRQLLVVRPGTTARDDDHSTTDAVRTAIAAICRVCGVPYVNAVCYGCGKPQMCCECVVVCMSSSHSNTLIKAVISIFLLTVIVPLVCLCMHECHIYGCRVWLLNLNNRTPDLVYIFEYIFQTRGVALYWTYILIKTCRMWFVTRTIVFV